MNPEVYVWIGIAVLAVIAELATPALVAVWFIPGALIAMVLAMLSVSLWIQILVFIAVSFVCMWFGRRLVRRLRRNNPPEKTNADALVGKSCVVTEDICNLEDRGQVRINGQLWSARSEQGQDIPAQTVVTVQRIEGVKLICR